LYSTFIIASFFRVLLLYLFSSIISGLFTKNNFLGFDPYAIQHLSVYSFRKHILLQPNQRNPTQKKSRFHHSLQTKDSYTHENVFLCFHLRALCFQNSLADNGFGTRDELVDDAPLIGLYLTAKLNSICGFRPQTKHPH